MHKGSCSMSQPHVPQHSFYYLCFFLLKEKKLKKKTTTYNCLFASYKLHLNLLLILICNQGPFCDNKICTGRWQSSMLKQRITSKQSRFAFDYSGTNNLMQSMSQIRTNKNNTKVSPNCSAGLMMRCLFRESCGAILEHSPSTLNWISKHDFKLLLIILWVFHGKWKWCGICHILAKQIPQ